MYLSSSDRSVKLSYADSNFQNILIRNEKRKFDILKSENYRISLKFINYIANNLLIDYEIKQVFK
jgi:hypothetical protein